MLIVCVCVVTILLDVWSADDLPCGRECFFGFHISNMKHTECIQKSRVEVVVVGFRSNI